METRQQEEVLRKSDTLQWHPERRKGEPLKEEASRLGQEELATGGQRCQVEGERPSQGSAEATLRLPNGCRRGSSSLERESSTEERHPRPTRDSCGPGQDESLASLGEEVARLQRSVEEDPKSDGKGADYEESLMRELSEKVQKVVKNSSWWERHGIDATILALNFLVLPVGKQTAEDACQTSGV